MKTKMAARSGILGLGSRLHPGNMQRMLNKDLTRFMQSRLQSLYPFLFPELRSSWPAPRIESSGKLWQALAGSNPFSPLIGQITIKMITGRNRKRMAEGILFSVCRTCNRYIISNNHPLDLFGEKTIREGIGLDSRIPPHLH